MASQVYDELYAEYGREPTEAEVVSRLKSRIEEARTAAGATPDATRPDRPVYAEFGRSAVGELDPEAPDRGVREQPSKI